MSTTKRNKLVAIRSGIGYNVNRKAGKIMTEAVTIYVYGSEVPCASCVGAPSSKETEEWLRAAIRRKFPEQTFTVSYVDIFDPPQQEGVKQLAEKIVKEDYIYPVVVLDDEIIAEGNPRLKAIYAHLLEKGYIAQLS